MKHITGYVWILIAALTFILIICPACEEPDDYSPFIGEWVLYRMDYPNGECTTNISYPSADITFAADNVCIVYVGGCQYLSRKYNNHIEYEHMVCTNSCMTCPDIIYDFGSFIFDENLTFTINSNILKISRASMAAYLYKSNTTLPETDYECREVFSECPDNPYFFQDGAFCAISAKLIDYCFAGVNSTVTDHEILICLETIVNVYWDEFCDAVISEEDFDPDYQKNLFLQTLSELTPYPVVIEVAKNLIKTLMPLETVEDCQSCTDFFYYMNILKTYDPSDETWITASDYIKFLGIDTDDDTEWYQVIVNTINEFDDVFKITGETDSIEAAFNLCPDFDADSLSVDTPENIKTLLTYLAEEGETDEQWTVLINNLFSSGNEIEQIADIVFNAAADLLSLSEDNSAISGLVPTLPSLISGFITSDMSLCE